MVIINKDTLQQKINTFIQDNHITRLKKDPTETFQKQIQQALQTCNSLIETNGLKYLINIKPKAPNLNAYIKTHKEGAPIRPVVNSLHAPSYKTAKLLIKKLLNLVNLLNFSLLKTHRTWLKIYITSNSITITG
jgi:hypothetical protein